jgi:hypothetical protein
VGITVSNLSNIKLFDHTLTTTTRLAVVQLAGSIDPQHDHFKIPEILLTALHTHTQLSMKSNKLMVFIIIFQSLGMTLTAICTNMNNLTAANKKSYVTAPML